MKRALLFVGVTSVIAVGVGAALVVFVPQVREVFDEKRNDFRADFSARETQLRAALAPDDDQIASAREHRATRYV